jgi:endonuclease/exonuclease/phosphatase family metal-dependent hydrolase
MSTPTSALTVASINIERSKHLARVAAFLRTYSPDVVCLQELVPDDIPVFRDDLGYEHHVCIPMARFPEHGQLRLTGVGIFSRRPFEFTEDIAYAGGGSGSDVVDRTSDETRFQTARYTLAVVGIRSGGDTYTIATTHFPWTENARTSDFQRTACDALLRVLKDRPLVLCGDFNAPRGGEIFSRLAAHWTDHIPPAYASSLDPVLHRAPHLRLMVDGVFSTSDYRVSEVALHQGVSDHCAATAVIGKRGRGDACP